MTLNEKEMEKKLILDKSDLSILPALARDCSTSYSNISSQISLTAKSVKARVKKMVLRGVIEKFVIQITSPESVSVIVLVCTLLHKFVLLLGSTDWVYLCTNVLTHHPDLIHIGNSTEIGPIILTLHDFSEIAINEGEQHPISSRLIKPEHHFVFDIQYTYLHIQQQKQIIILQLK